MERVCRCAVGSRDCAGGGSGYRAEHHERFQGEEGGGIRGGRVRGEQVFACPPHEQPSALNLKLT